MNCVGEHRRVVLLVYGVRKRVEEVEECRREFVGVLFGSEEVLVSW